MILTDILCNELSPVNSTKDFTTPVCYSLEKQYIFAEFSIILIHRRKMDIQNSRDFSCGKLNSETDKR